MSGALEMFEQALGRLRMALHPKLIRDAADQVGSQYSLAADALPVFERGRRFANSPEGLALQFGTSPPTRIPKSDQLSSVYDYAISPNPNGKAKDLGNLLAEVRDYPYMVNPGEAGGYDAVIDLREAGLLPRGADYHLFDTQGLRQNSGEGTRAYATAFGNLRLNPNALNVATALSGANAKRRNANMASALLRDPSLSQNILINPSQLAADKYRLLNDIPPLNAAHNTENVWATPKSFHTLTPQQQMGALQMIQAHDSLAAMRAAYMRDRLRADAPYQTEKQAQETLGRLNAMRGMDYYAIDALGGGSPAPGALSGLARAYQSTPSSSLMPMGLKTLRNTRLVGDMLEGRDWKSVPPELWEGLFYCDGGRVSPEA